MTNLLSITEAKNLLRVSPQRIRAMVDAGILEAVPIPACGEFGAGIRIVAASVERVLEGRVAVEEKPQRSKARNEAQALIDRYRI